MSYGRVWWLGREEPAARGPGGEKPTFVTAVETLPPPDGRPEAVVAAAGITKPTALRAVALGHSRGADVFVDARTLPELARVVPTAEAGGRPYIPFPAPRPRLYPAAFKPMADKTLALALILLLSPVWLPLFAAIKLDSKGPVIFRQKRLTRRKKEYNIYKFRTMFADVPRYQLSPGHGDDIRVTRVGRWLRNTGLDETAQLINVLKGQMSIVGPRPEMAVVAATYEPWQDYRFVVRPGITGLWQIAGRADLPIHDALEYDFYYISHMSPAWDARILIKTIPLLFGKAPRP